MIRRPPRYTLTDAPFTYTAPFRSPPCRRGRRRPAPTAPSRQPDRERRRKQAVVWSSASVAAGVGVSTGGPLRRNAAGSRPVDAVIVADAGRYRLSHRWTAPGAGFSPCCAGDRTRVVEGKSGGVRVDY